MKIAVETKKLTKIYNGIKAVNDLDLSVPQGSIYGFLGPNGAGKTTTLKMITGLIRPTSGTISIFGTETVFGGSKNFDGIGFLPDVSGFYNWMTSVDYLDFCGRLFRMEGSKLNEKITKLLKLVGLEDSKKKKIGSYSRGMKQRLGIAQTLIYDPKIVILDEPVSALDPVGRKEVMDIISKLADRVTVFFSTHVLEDVERVCDRVVIIKDGIAVLEDTIENIKRSAYSKEIEIETENMIDLKEIIGNINWIEEIRTVNASKIIVVVSDIETAMKEFPGLIYEKKLKLKKFYVVEPTLEDVFVRTVNGK